MRGGGVGSLRAYAGTSVTPAQTRQDIQQLLEKVGAKGFRWSSTVGFPGQEALDASLLYQDRQISFRLQIAFGDERVEAENARPLLVSQGQSGSRPARHR